MRERLSTFVRTFFFHYPRYAKDTVQTWRDMSARLGSYGLARPRILEVGCGSLYPYVLLFGAAGVKAIGVDLLPLQPKAVSIRGLLRRHGGRGAAHLARRSVRDLLFWWGFYRVMKRAAGRALPHDGVCLLQMDAERLSFSDESFDLVFSTACFEHLPDVSRVVDEIHRVLRPGGIAEIEIHLFASMTGGHEPELYTHHPPPPGFRVWGHLTDSNWPAPLYLNRWREQQYVDVFTRGFTVRSRTVSRRHGEQYLTPEVLAQLSPEYSKEELLTESVLYVLEKPSRRR